MKETCFRLLAAAAMLLFFCTACRTGPGSESRPPVSSSSSSQGSSQNEVSSQTGETSSGSVEKQPEVSAAPESSDSSVEEPESSEPETSSSWEEPFSPSSEISEPEGELSPIEEIVKHAEDKRDLQLSQTPQTSESAANRYFYQMVVDQYVDFGVFVTSPEYAHTAEEYAQLFPGLDSIKVTHAVVYSNGYYFRYKITRNANFALKTALLSGNTEYLTEKEQAAYRNLNTILNTHITDEMSAADQVRAIHDYIVLNTAYDLESESPYDATGVLVDGKAVCDGYSKAFLLFMDALHIPCVRITGTAGGVNHAWNAVQLGGNWYQIDATWDDPTPDTPGLVSYAYFLITDEMMAQDHTWTYSPVKCTDDSLLLYPYEGCVATTLDGLQAIYQAQKDAEQSFITLVYPTRSFGSDENIVLYLGASSYYPSFQRGEWSVLVIRG